MGRTVLIKPEFISLKLNCTNCNKRMWEGVGYISVFINGRPFIVGAPAPQRCQHCGDVKVANALPRFATQQEISDHLLFVKVAFEGNCFDKFPLIYNDSPPSSAIH